MMKILDRVLSRANNWMWRKSPIWGQYLMRGPNRHVCLLLRAPFIGGASICLSCSGLHFSIWSHGHRHGTILTRHGFRKPRN